jgi:succinyl-CoA synthetase beta subunit
VTADTPGDAEKLAAKLLGSEIGGFQVHDLLVEERLQVEREWYTSVTFDRAAAAPVVVFSTLGGVDVEQAVHESPGKFHRVNVDPLWGFHTYQARKLLLDAGVPADLQRQTVDILLRLWKMFKNLDCELAEINPVVVTTDNKVIAGDAKVTVDDSALYRQPDVAGLHRRERGNPAEHRASELGLSYVSLEGDVGLIGNGAGLVMAALDAVHRNGGSAANFLDLGGGAGEELVRGAFDILQLQGGVKSVFFNVFGGITRCDVVARGLLNFAGSGNLRWPVVVRLAGNNADIGLEMLADSPFDVAAGIEDGARRAVWLAGEVSVEKDDTGKVGKPHKEVGGQGGGGR